MTLTPHILTTEVSIYSNTIESDAKKILFWSESCSAGTNSNLQERSDALYYLQYGSVLFALSDIESGPGMSNDVTATFKN